MNVKLPEPIWSCITRTEGSYKEKERGREGERDSARKGWKLDYRGGGARLETMAHCESYLSCCPRIYGVSTIAYDPVVRSYWPIIDGYSAVLSAICKETRGWLSPRCSRLSLSSPFLFSRLPRSISSFIRVLVFL